MSPVVLDAMHKIQYFDGRCLHATKAFLCERYSLVFFLIRGADKVPERLQKELVAQGASCKLWQFQRV